MTNSLVFYIHGFGSSVNSETLQSLRKFYPDAEGLTYDHDQPFQSISTMVKDVRATAGDRDVVIVGSSLGAWYAEQLTAHIVGDFIMYNPCTQPEVSLHKYGVGIDTLQAYKLRSTKTLPPASRTVVLCFDDVVIDPRIADVKYSSVSDMLYTNGGHRMTPYNLSIIVDKIKFLQNQIP